MGEGVPLDPVVDATEVVTRTVVGIEDPLWRLELATHSAMTFAQESEPRGSFANAMLQATASIVALATLLWLALRHGGTSPAVGREALAGADTVFVLHAEDTTRTRHLRQALAERGATPGPILLQGRPRRRVDEAAAMLDPVGSLAGATYLRPLTFGIACAAIGQAFAQLAQGVRETARYRAALPFRERVACAFRAVLGVSQARWWCEAAGAKCSSPWSTSSARWT